MKVKAILYVLFVALYIILAVSLTVQQRTIELIFVTMISFGIASLYVSIDDLKNNN